MDSSAFLVEGKYVFRFPKLPEVTKSLRNEMAILGQLSGTGILFVGYRKIDGVPLNEINPLKLPTDIRQEVTTSLAKFLKEIHSFSIADARKKGVPETCFMDDYADDWNRLQKEVFPNITRTTQQYLETLYTEYLSESSNFHYTQVLLGLSRNNPALTAWALRNLETQANKWIK